jgi:hypothetical protein
MPEQDVLNDIPAIPATNPATDSDRDKGRDSQGSIRATLRQAVELKDLTFQVALELAHPVVSDTESDLVRARAQAIAGLVKAWDMACNRIRIQQGKPLPGSHRPEPKKPKQSKAKTGPAFTEEQ